jgi:hypothetical protein
VLCLGCKTLCVGYICWWSAAVQQVVGCRMLHCMSSSVEWQTCCSCCKFMLQMQASCLQRLCRVGSTLHC